MNNFATFFSAFIVDPYVLQAFFVILFAFVFNLIIKKILLKLQNRFKEEQRIWPYSMISAIYKPLSYFTWFLAILVTVNVIAWSIFKTDIPYLYTLISIVGVVTLGWFLMRWNTGLTQQMLQLSYNKKIGLTPSSLDLISKITTIVIIFIIVLLLLDVTGHNVQTLVAFGGISGVAIAFASQQFISNFFGGLSIYLTQPFSIGENIQVPDRKIEGIVEEIGWYMTRIRNDEKKPIYVPNSIFNQSVVVTPSRNTHQRLYLKIGLHYKNIDIVQSVVDAIGDMLRSHPAINQHMEIKVFFIGFGSTALEIEISAYAAKELKFDRIKQDILIQIASIINDQGAEIAALTNIVEMKESTPSIESTET